MDNQKPTLLPYVLETLCRRPELSDTFNHLCKDIEGRLAKEHNGSYGNVRSSLQNAIKMGQNLGILTFINQVVRVPFNFCVKAEKAPAIVANSVAGQLQDQPAVGTANSNPTPQRAGVLQRITRPMTQQKQAVSNYGGGQGAGGAGGNGGGGGGAASEIPARTIPAPFPMPIRRPRMYRMARPRTPARSRGRSRSTGRRRGYRRRRPLRSRSSYGRRRR